jgi:hypothetical protein
MYVIYIMNHEQQFYSIISMSSADLLNMVVKHIPAKQPTNHGSSVKVKEKLCIKCDELKPLTEFTHALKKDGTPRKDKRARVCNECHKTEEGRAMETYRVRV